MLRRKTLDGFLEKKIIHNMNANAKSSQCGCLSNRYQWSEPPLCFEHEFVWKREGKWFCMKQCNLKLMNEEKIPTLKVSTAKNDWMSSVQGNPKKWRKRPVVPECTSMFRVSHFYKKINEENKWHELIIDGKQRRMDSSTRLTKEGLPLLNSHRMHLQC